MKIDNQKKYSLSKDDIEQIENMGSSLESILKQLEFHESGFPYLQITESVSEKKGIFSINEENIKHYEEIWENTLKNGAKVVKFVPASGAASRMFKDLFAFIDSSHDTPTTRYEKIFFDNIQSFAFFKSLDDICVKNNNKHISELIDNKQYKDIIRNLLLPIGLNYGALPKGLLKFHKYKENEIRTPLEEQLYEGFLYAASENVVNIHFTVSPDHLTLFKQVANYAIEKLEKEKNIKFELSFSEQKKRTDTIAVSLDNLPFRTEAGILFRAGGHGALIENLNDIQADYIFIKNIDNVVLDKLKTDEAKYKKLLAGILIEKQKQAFEYLNKLDIGDYTQSELIDMLQFIQKVFFIKNTDIKNFEDAELAVYIRKTLNRPIRVCGVVKNVGEPGGGPFFVIDKDKVITPQIIESSQIDLTIDKNRELFDKSSFFNPVDLVCGVKNYKGDKFNLLNYIDHETGFISEKSLGGKNLKALELPGLWNGAMSQWNTIFVEVPITTFNPVKTVNDLLRDEHRG